MIDFKCSNASCPKTFSVQEEFAGKKTRCPKCGATLRVPFPHNPGAHTASPGAALPPQAPQPRFYFVENGQKYGPASLKQMQDRVVAQRLRPDDLVWREGAPQWVAARAIPELFQNPQVVPSAPAAPTVPAEAAAETPSADAARAPFGMARLVYWSALFGGWSALVGWAVAELLIGRWVGRHFLLAVLMVLLVASGIGAGLSQIDALTTSQWRSQRKQLIPGLIGGLAGGLFGGLLGNLLFRLVGGEAAFLGFMGRLLGWTLLGTSIGICDGLLRRDWRRFRNGLIGGSIGGFLGGLFFNPVSYLIGSPVSSRAFAFVLLGLCIGLFVGLVQVLLKEAWVTVQGGFRPGRQLILNDTLTTMGTSEKANLIFIAYGAKGVEPIHLRIRRADDGSYLLEDNGSRSGTFLNGRAIAGPERLANGDVIRFGVNEVRFQERYRPSQASQASQAQAAPA